MDVLTIIFLAALNFFLSFYSVIVGGGSLVMVPLLISLGVPAPNSVAIARFYNLGTGFSSLFEFNRGGKVNWKIGLPLATAAVFSSLFASYLVLSIDEGFLKTMIALLILFVLAIMILKKDVGVKVRKERGLAFKFLGFILTFLSIFVFTFVGGGSGIAMSYILIFLFGQTFLESMGTRKIVTLTALIFSAGFFIFAGAVRYEIAFPLLVTGALGGWAGAKYAMRKGDKWVRVFFIAVTLVITINMLLQV